MSKVFWQAKIWGLLHDPIFKALHTSGRGKNSLWEKLAVMQDWIAHGLNPETSGGKAMKQMHLADLITSASDRGAIGTRTWLELEHPTIADVAVFPYVALARDGKINLDKYPQVLAWIDRFKQLPGYIPMEGI